MLDALELNAEVTTELVESPRKLRKGMAPR